MTTKLEVVNRDLKAVVAPTVRERAAGLAEDANDCCNRSDGWEENMEKLAYTQLSEVVEECALIAEGYWLEVKATEAAHHRYSDNPFKMEDFGYNRSVAERSREVAHRIRALVSSVGEQPPEKS